ncbi:unnamed protein product [Larinioides sclopetarius]|uniref:Uncharacterized protein n=1 Tax=Larinioides sclopetarius TaxID=280406 RepID=A0AAV2A2F1_9ARAC
MLDWYIRPRVAISTIISNQLISELQACFSLRGSFNANRQHEDHNGNVLYRVCPHHFAAAVFTGCHAHGWTHGRWRWKRCFRDSGRRHHS